MSAITQLQEWIRNSENIVFFGGAGVSTESNIPDFRSSAGLYSTSFGNFSAETVLSRSFFDKHTHEFYEFYRQKMIYPDAQPNKAHKALTKLEQEKKLKAIITQNIDGLHQMASSKNVLELHGSILKNRCMSCGEKYNLDYIFHKNGIPYCKKCHGIIKPEVTLYEEALNMSVFETAIDFITKADVFIVAGTSLVVYPAASLTRYYRGNKLVLINRDATSYDKYANLLFHESIGEVLSEAIQ